MRSFISSSSAKLFDAILGSKFSGSKSGLQSKVKTADSDYRAPMFESLEGRQMMSTTILAAWNTYTGNKSASNAPQAIAQLLSTTAKMVGIAVVVDGTESTVGDGSPITSIYHWNFGDPNGKYNDLPGFNASHVYTAAGNYTITLTVTNDLGKTSTASIPITISPDTRKIIYVDSVSGNDNNNGLTPGTAVQTAYRADRLTGNNVEVLFKRGETFNLTGTFLNAYSNEIVGAYGTGANPVMNWDVAGGGAVMFSTSNGLANGVTFEDLTFTALDGTEMGSGNSPYAIKAANIDISVLDCTFLSMMYCVNANSSPTGLLVQDCSSPAVNSTYGYFIWDQGQDSVILGNYVADSEHEHNVRTSSANDILVADNNFTNNDGKGCIEVHWGQYAWVADNTVHGGDIRTGPLGLWGESPTSATTYAVIEANNLINSWVQIDPGSHHVSVRNNVIQRNSVMMIDVSSSDPEGRTSSDIQIINNTGLSTGTTGNFLKVQNHTDGILLENNLVIAPDLIPGGYGTAIVSVDDTNLSSFTYINGNVWQLPAKIYGYANGGINLVNGLGYLTPSAWNALSQVGTDYFTATATATSVEPATSNSNFVTAAASASAVAPANSSFAASVDSAVAGVFYDYYGDLRPISGKWSAGAVQV